MMNDVLIKAMKRKSFTNVHVYADMNGDTAIQKGKYYGYQKYCKKRR